MEFRILGPLEVCTDGGRALNLAGKQRSVLAILLLHANEPVSTDRLIDDLWGAEPPETAVKAVQVYVSQLRKLLEPDRSRGSSAVLVTRPPGYALELGRHELDAHRFERLRDEAKQAMAADDPATAAAKLREALSLWRGPPLADFVFEPFAQNEIARLEELRLATIEDRIDVDLALGRHADVVGELDALVAEHPLRERVRAQLILALYRARRQVEALESYQAARRALVDELGIEPSPELQELERRILRQDPSLDVAAPVTRVERAAAHPVPATTPSRHAAGAFVGRASELGVLEAGLEDAFAGRGRLFLLTGEPGIGKSRLADEFASRARERNTRVLWGRCWEAGGAPAYWPWVQSLRSYVRSRDPDSLREELGGRAADVAQLLPDLREFIPDLPDAQGGLDPEGARFRLFDSVATFLRNAASKQPLVLVLDDLHVADEPSLLLLQFLAGELAEMPVVAVGAYREEDVPDGTPAAANLAELARLASRRIRLGGLSRDDVASFVELSANVTPPDELVAAIHTESEGNPLFVGEVVRLFAAEGRLSQPLGAALDVQIPRGVREVIARRLRRLSKECRRVLTLAAALGREFSLEALETVSREPEEELLDALDEAFAARVLTEVPGAVDRVRFSHARIRDALYEDLSTARRTRLHHRIGEALEVLYSPNPEPYLAELAQHFFLAGPKGDVEKAIEYTRRAGGRAVALLAYEEAVRLYRMSLRALARRAVEDDAETCELLLALGDAQTRAGDEAGARESFLQAVERAKNAGRPEQLAQAALGYGGRFVWARAGSDRRLVALLEEGIAGLGEQETALKARLLARLAGALRDEPDRERRALLSEQAVEIARRVGEPATLAYALDGRYAAVWWPENLDQRLAIANELVELADEIGDKERVFQGRGYLLDLFVEQGEVEKARSEFELKTRAGDELRQPAQQWLTLVVRGMFELFEGNFAEAEALVADALAHGRGAQARDALMSYRLQLYFLRREQGRLAELEATVKQSIEEYPGYPLLRCLLAHLYSELGREAEARTVFEELAANDFADLYPDNEWLFGVCLLPEVARFLSDGERARRLHGLLLPFARRNVFSPPEVSIGSVSRYLGVLAHTMSRFGEAERHFHDALRLNGAMGARPWLAYTEHDYGRMLLDRREPGDEERARELLQASLARSSELHMEELVRRVTALTTTAPAVPG